MQLIRVGVAGLVLIVVANLQADPPGGPQGCSNGCIESGCIKMATNCVRASRTTCWDGFWGLGAGGTVNNVEGEYVSFEIVPYCDKECPGKDDSNANGCDGTPIGPWSEPSWNCWCGEEEQG
jgi:hypothetical protein